VALGERFQQLILVLTEADPQDSTSPLQFPPLPRSVLLVQQLTEYALKPCSGYAVHSRAKV
jgi:hypothetical protein